MRSLLIKSLYDSYYNELLELKSVQASRANHMETPFDDIECELLYMFVRALRPKSVVEFSPYQGWSTTWLLEAMNRNGVGDCVAYDLVSDSREKLHELDIDCSRWRLVVDDVTKHYSSFDYDLIDFIFIDSDHSREFAEKYVAEVLIPAKKYCSEEDKNTLVFIHDILHTTWECGEQQVIKDFLSKNNITYITASEMGSSREQINKIRNKLGLDKQQIQWAEVNPGVFFIL